MLTPLAQIKSLVTLDVSDIGYVDNDSPEVRFCEGRDSHTDADCPLLLELHEIGPLVLPNLVALDINHCQGATTGFLKNIICNAPGRMCMR